MLFHSLTFAVFLPLVFLLYWIFPQKYRWILILAASYYFYMGWNARYLLLIMVATGISYFAGILLDRVQGAGGRKGILAGGIIGCISILFFYKYFDFFSESLAAIAGAFAIQLSPYTLKLLLPVGISFYTFQVISYMIDVYRGKVKAEYHLGHYAAFISFFPQLVAGPIERTEHLLPQIKEGTKFDADKAIYGLKLMAWGFFKKLVIADNLAPIVERVFEEPQQFRGFALVLATIFFAIQIYCDFSGYSDIAIGTARLFGIELMTNFRSPYFSQNLKEFWDRWHISLSTWLRDYIYIPMGGNRVGKFRKSINLMVTFFASGLWHGANWTFVVWGMVHGAARVVEDLVSSAITLPNRIPKRLIRICKTAVVFAFCCFAWIFFVSNSVEDAFYVITNLFVNISQGPYFYVYLGLYDLQLLWAFKCCLLIVSILILALYDAISLKRDCIEVISKKPALIRYAVYLFVIAMILCFRAAEPAQFVYFQF